MRTLMNFSDIFQVDRFLFTNMKTRNNFAIQFIFINDIYKAIRATNVHVHVCCVQHDATTASQQGLPPAPVLLDRFLFTNMKTRRLQHSKLCMNNFLPKHE
jgi:hypothetical protein